MKKNELMMGDIVYDSTTGCLREVEEVKDLPFCRPVVVTSKGLMHCGFRQAAKVDGTAVEYIYILPLGGDEEKNNVTYFAGRSKIQNFNIRIRGHKVLEGKVQYYHEIQHFLRHVGLHDIADKIIENI